MTSSPVVGITISVASKESGDRVARFLTGKTYYNLRSYCVALAGITLLHVESSYGAGTVSDEERKEEITDFVIGLLADFAGKALKGEEI